MKRIIMIFIVLLAGCGSRSAQRLPEGFNEVCDYLAYKIIEIPCRDNDYRVVLNVSMYISDDIECKIDNTNVEFVAAKKKVANKGGDSGVILVPDNDEDKENSILRDTCMVVLVNEYNLTFGRTQVYKITGKIDFKKIDLIRSCGLGIKFKSPYGDKTWCFNL